MNLLTPLEIEALLLSLKVSTVAVAISLPFGVALSWMLARRRFFGKAAIDGLIHLPLVVPPVVTGYLLLIVLGRNGLVGKILYDALGVSFTMNWKGAAIASGVVSFPLLVRAVRISISGVDKRLEVAATTLGAGRWRVFFTISLPLMIPGIISGCIMAFIRSISEFGATVTFVANIPGQTNTISLAIYNLIQTPEGDSGAIRLCIISIAAAMAALVISEILTKKHQNRLEN